MGVWIALEDATIDNGCLWFIPGSHQSKNVWSWSLIRSHFHSPEPIQRRYIRNPNEEEFNDGKMLTFVGTEERYDDQSFVPVEIKAGNRSQSNNSKMQVYIWPRRCSSDPWSSGP